jgi:hypothetical protein
MPQSQREKLPQLHGCGSSFVVFVFFVEKIQVYFHQP